MIKYLWAVVLVSAVLSTSVVDQLGNTLSLTAPVELVAQQWDDFVLRFNRQYSSLQETKNKYEVFSKNYQFIHRHNLLQKHQPGYSTFQVGVNDFADLTNEEFVKRNGLKLGSQEEYQKRVVVLAENLGEAAQKDWREDGAVTPVRNQGSCGSCWTFSTCGALESLNFIQRDTESDLSEQMLVDCSTKGVNKGCQGGSMPTAYEHVEQYGIMAESEYPYQGKQQTCRYNRQQVVLNIGGYNNVQQRSGRQLKAAIDQNPVSVGIDSKGQSFQFYKSGVFSRGCGTQIDHAVLVVGYKYDRYNSQDSYYIVKNSWGSQWGEDGYIRMVDNDQDGQGICGIQMWSSYPYI